MGSLGGESLPTGPDVSPRLRAEMSNAYLPLLYGIVSSGSSQFTFGANFQLEAQPTGIRLILANYGAGATLAGLCAAASASAASGTTPVDGSGNPVAWTQATVNGGALVMPAGTATAPAYQLTDLMPIEGIARTDGGSGFLIYTRAASPTSGYAAMTAQADTFADLNTALGRPINQYLAAGNYASSNQAGLVDAGASFGFQTFYVAGIVFETEQRCVTLGGFGDSLTQGHFTVGEYAGFARRAANQLSSSACAVSFVDGGFSGETIAVICARVRAVVAAGIPLHLVTLPIDSPNDYLGNPGFESRIALESTVLSTIDYLLSLGIVVVALTSLPFGPNGVDQYSAQRVISSAKLRAMTQRGLVVLDAAQIICGYIPTASQPAVVPASLLTTQDGEHYDDVGQALLASALQDVVSPLLA